MNREMISGYQLFMMTCFLYVNGGMISLFKTLAEVSNQDAWIDFFFPMAYAMLIALLMYRLSVRYPGRNLFEICETACGKWFGRGLNVLALLYILHLLIRDLRIFGDFVGTSILQRTPTEFIYLATVLVFIYYGTGNVEVHARATNLIFPIFMVSVGLLPFLLLNEIDIRNIQPILSKGWLPVIKGGFLGTGWAGDVFVLGLLLSNLPDAKRFYVSVKYGVVVSTFILSLLLFLNIAVLGWTTIARAMYPSYTMVEQINITDFLDRLDLALIAFWMPAFLVKTALIYHCFLAGLATMLGAGKMRALNVMSGWFLLTLTLISFNSVMEVYRFGNYGAIPIALFVHTCFFAGVFAAGRRRAGESGVRKREARGEDRAALRRMRIAAAACFAAILFGGCTGAVYKAYGIASAIVYTVSFLCLVWFGTQQFWRHNRV